MIDEDHCADNDKNDGPPHFMTVDIRLVVFIDESIYRVHEIEFFIVVLYASDQEDRDNDQADCNQDWNGDSQDVR